MVLLWSAPAWADPELRPSPASGPAGSEVTITGTGFADADVEIHWGDQSGPVLGTARGPDFSVKVVIPDSPPNSYSLVAVVREGSTVMTSNTSFQLTPAAEPVETTTTTSPPERVPEPNPPVVDRTPTDVETRGAGVTGGLDPSLPDTVDRVPDSSGAVAGSTPVGAPADPVAAANAAAAGAPAAGPGGAVTTTPLPPGTPPADATSSPEPGVADAAASAGRGQRASRALGPAPTSQSSVAVRSPVLLFAGLGMIMAGAAFLAYRNRHRLRS